MTIEEKVVCEHCGAVHAIKKHPLTKYITDILPMIYDAGGVIQLGDLKLSKAQYCNIQKLKYWGLIDPVRTPENELKRGGWKITQRGRDFVEGKIMVYKNCYVKDKDVVDYDGELLYIHQISPGVKLRGEYADEIRQQIMFDQ